MGFVGQWLSPGGRPEITSGTPRASCREGSLLCRWTVKACERQLENLKRQKSKEWRFKFDHEKAARICRTSPSAAGSGGLQPVIAVVANDEATVGASVREPFNISAELARGAFGRENPVVPASPLKVEEVMLVAGRVL